jgi:glycine/D-amino acid oxidase-like deaminating enzyme
VQQRVTVVGGGIVGRSAAWWLQRRGHQVTLVDGALNNPHAAAEAGSWAALGLLMAQVFHRSSGRAWQLRQHSLALWEQWISELGELGYPLQLRRGLLLLAAGSEELARQQQLCQARQALGMPLELWSQEQVAALQPALPAQALGGLWSPNDGQLDPEPVLQALLAAAQRLGVQTLAQRVVAFEPGSSGGWCLRLADGQTWHSPWLVLAAGVGTAALLQPLGLGGAAPSIEPVLGQALELESGGHDPWSWDDLWPAAVVWQGTNLVPRRQPGQPGRLWLGATLEPGERAEPEALQAMASLNGNAPTWLQQASVMRHWQGLRARPRDRPAPWLEHLQPGLLVASAHYRNGLLLAPATATWIAQQLEAP